MKKALFLLITFAVGAVFWGCSSADDDGLTNNRQWTVSAIAAKDSGEVLTRALFIGGVGGNRYVSLWEKNDVILAYRAGDISSSIGSLSPVTADVAISELTGSLTGSFSAGDYLDFYMPAADIDYNGQKGSLTDMTKYAYMHTTVKIDRIEDGKIYTENIKFAGEQCYLRLRFVDPDGIRLHVEQLTISTTSGQILLSKPLGGAAVHGDLVINPEKENGEYPSEVYVALHNDLNDTDTYTFMVKAGGYIYGGTTGNMTFKLVDTKYYLTTRTLTLQGSASRIQSSSEVSNFENGNGATGESGSVTF